MSRSTTAVRGGLFGLAVAVALGFGATQAVGSTAEAQIRTCPARPYDYAYASCGFGCPGNRGYCAEGGICRCGLIP